MTLMSTRFSLWLGALFATAALAAPGAALAAPPLLVPAELQSLLQTPVVVASTASAGPTRALRVIDIRPPAAYAEGHIPGAVSAPYGAWRGPASNPGELPPLNKLTELVRKLGLTPDTHAVVVSGGTDATDFGASARVYWTLKVLGLSDLSVLNGGVRAWSAAGLPLSTEPARVAASDFTPALDSRMIATRDEVQAHIQQRSGRLIDARPTNFFEGQTRHAAARIPGTLKGATQLEYTRWFEDDSAVMKSADAVRQLAGAAPPEATDTVSFCNTGHWAAINWFALSEVAGQPGVRLYPGSMVEWAQATGAQESMDRVPNRLTQLMIDLQFWVDRTFN